MLARPELQRYAEAAAHCESAAAVHVLAGDAPRASALLDGCLALLQAPSPSPEGRTPDFPIRVPATPPLLRWLRRCLSARRGVVVALAESQSPTSPGVKALAYRYLAGAGDECRAPPPALAPLLAAVEEAGGERVQATSYHTQLVHV